MARRRMTMLPAMPLIVTLERLGPGVARRLALTDGPSRISQRMDTVGVRPAGAVLDGWNRAGPHPRRAQPLRTEGTRSAPGPRGAG